MGCIHVIKRQTCYRLCSAALFEAMCTVDAPVDMLFVVSFMDLPLCHYLNDVSEFYNFNQLFYVQTEFRSYSSILMLENILLYYVTHTHFTAFCGQNNKVETRSLRLYNCSDSKLAICA